MMTGSGGGFNGRAAPFQIVLFGVGVWFGVVFLSQSVRTQKLCCLSGDGGYTNKVILHVDYQQRDWWTSDSPVTQPVDDPPDSQPLDYTVSELRNMPFGDGKLATRVARSQSARKPPAAHRALR